MRNRTTEDTICLLGGALLGAVAMYVLDPEQGDKRRQRIATAAEGAVEATRDTLNEGWDAVTDHAHRVAAHAQSVADSAADTGHSASKYTQRLADQAHGIAADLTDSAAGYVRSGRKSANRARKAGWNLWGRAQDAYGDAADAASDRASDLADGARDTGAGLAAFGSRLWDRARHLGENLGDWTGSTAKDVKDTGNDYTGRVRGLASHVGRRASSAGSHARAWWNDEDADAGFGTGTFVSTAVTTAALGVGLMYFLDPQRGRARRSWAVDKTNSIVRQTGRTMRSTGQHVANRLYGTAYETQKLARGYMGGQESGGASSEQLVQRIRSQMGHYLTTASNVELMGDADGTITLTGSVARDQLDGLLSLIHAVPGVTNIVNRLSVTDTPAEGSSSAQSTSQPQSSLNL